MRFPINRILFFVIFAGLILLSSCVSVPKDRPYRKMSDWILRQNDVPQYFAEFDILYYAPDYFEVGKDKEELYTETHLATVEQVDKFFPLHYRVFAPLIYDERDVKSSYKYYLKNFHDKYRPFIFVASGIGIDLVKPLEKKAKKQGLMMAIYGDKDHTNEMLTEQVIDETRARVKEWKYMLRWNKDPEDTMMWQMREERAKAAKKAQAEEAFAEALAIAEIQAYDAQVAEDQATEEAKSQLEPPEQPEALPEE